MKKHSIDHTQNSPKHNDNIVNFIAFGHQSFSRETSHLHTNEDGRRGPASNLSSIAVYDNQQSLSCSLSNKLILRVVGLSEKVVTLDISNY
jgi:hypothetical protein